MDLKPLVSVGLPTYNRPEGLEKTIKYLISQDYQNLEIIISDNCSTNNNVKKVLEKYSSLDKRIVFFIQKENIEIEPNFNFVFHKAAGKYFMWLADDDEFESNYISKCVSFLETNLDYKLCSGIPTYYKNGNYIFKEKPIQLSSNIAVFRIFKYFAKVYKNGVFYGVYRNDMNFKSPIQKHIGGDWTHIARVALLGKINVLEDVKCIRSDDGGSSSRSKITSRWNFKGLQRVFLEPYISYSVAKYLFNEKIVKDKYPMLARTIIQIFIFTLLNLKFLLNSINKRVFKTLK